MKLINGDCYELLKDMDDGSIDLFLQDLPYGSTRNPWDVLPDLKRMWAEWLRVGKENAPFVFFSQKPLTHHLLNSMLELFRYDIIWYKSHPTGFLNANRMPLRSHEDILVFYRKPPIYNPQKTSGHARKTAYRTKGTSNYGEHGHNHYDSTDRFPISVLQFPSDKQKEAIHPTQKPIDLLRWLIRTYTIEGQVVFDGYSGSGSTAIACLLENRQFVGAELQAEYYNLAIERIQKYQQAA